MCNLSQSVLEGPLGYLQSRTTYKSYDGFMLGYLQSRTTYESYDGFMSAMEANMSTRNTGRMHDINNKVKITSKNRSPAYTVDAISAVVKLAHLFSLSQQYTVPYTLHV